MMADEQVIAVDPTQPGIHYTAENFIYIDTRRRFSQTELEAAFSKTSKIKNLDIYFRENECLALIPKFIRENINLKKVTITSLVNFSDWGYLSKVAEAIRDNANVKDFRLDFGFHPPNGDDMSHASKVLEIFREVVTELKLSFGDNNGPTTDKTGFASLAGQVGLLTGLKTLELQLRVHDAIVGEILDSIITNSSVENWGGNLRHLTISGNCLMPLSKLGGSFIPLCARNLEELTLDRPIQAEETATEMLAGYLTTRECRLTKFGLDLETDDENFLGAIIPALASNTSIRELNLIFFFRENLGFSPGEIIRDLLVQNKSVKSLTIYWGGLPEHAVCPQLVVEGLRNNSTLKSLKFHGYSQFGGGGVAQLHEDPIFGVVLHRDPIDFIAFGRAFREGQEDHCGIEMLDLGRACTPYALENPTKYSSFIGNLPSSVKYLKANFGGCNDVRPIIDFLRGVWEKRTLRRINFGLINPRVIPQFINLIAILLTNNPNHLQHLSFHIEGSREQTSRDILQPLVNPMRANYCLESLDIGWRGLLDESLDNDLEQLCVRNRVRKVVNGLSGDIISNNLPFNVVPSVLKSIQKSCANNPVLRSRHTASILFSLLKRTASPGSTTMDNVHDYLLNHSQKQQQQQQQQLPRE